MRAASAPTSHLRRWRAQLESQRLDDFHHPRPSNMRPGSRPTSSAKKQNRHWVRKCATSSAWVCASCGCVLLSGRRLRRPSARVAKLRAAVSVMSRLVFSAGSFRGRSRCGAAAPACRAAPARPAPPGRFRSGGRRTGCGCESSVGRTPPESADYSARDCRSAAA